MKIQFEETDRNYIDKVNEAIASGENIPILFKDIGSEISLDITINDIAKANNFILSIMRSANNTGLLEIEEMLGVRFDRINLYPNSVSPQVLDEVAVHLRAALSKLQGV